ncbi:alcohol dehydrogenase catalytic domain-containing protein [Dactylosporangium sp. NPDC005572]|uniref:zinc-dependent alcohol dehydrogenase n=1 Tax=Dactylosporangium sp. NPDC005572 TaxID=3156889 RepID=UPI0033AE7DF0
MTTDAMTAAVYHGVGDVRLESRPRPRPAAGEVLVRVRAAGVCGSDAAEYLHAPTLIRGDGRRAAEPVTLGHEFAGDIVEAGPGVDPARVGELVVCGAGISCGDCAMCRRGRTNLCAGYHTIGFHRDGGLAGYVTAPAGICVAVGDRGLGPDTAALGQPMAVAVHARRRGGAGPGNVALVVGVGGIGAFLTYACVAAGVRVWAADVAGTRLDLARALGAEQVIDVRTTAPAAALADAGLRADVVFEVTGTAGGLDTAAAATPPGGRLVLVGIQHGTPAVPAARWTLQEVDVLGTVAHVCADDLPAALDVLAARPTWADIAPTVHPLGMLVREGLTPAAPGAARPTKVLFDPAAVEARPAEHRRTPAAATRTGGAP